jgi:hypothetical protein
VIVTFSFKIKDPKISVTKPSIFFTIATEVSIKYLREENMRNLTIIPRHTLIQMLGYISLGIVSYIYFFKFLLTKIHVTRVAII